MNIYFWINANPKTVFNEIEWLPKWKRSGWPIKPEGKVWYLEARWLNFGLNLDNEL